ncbi:hypothetical protein [Flavobacterium sp. I3-2]|uniref:hypothetical protein n=1 Tax=Flavobacterium sp. I3-2 TaxID=2748319 RepID=UPI0015AB3240|nr:hypothetical protein [Flavobacterium sp. I3-2]
MNTIKIKLDHFLQNADSSIQELTFITDSKHPVWDDNAQIIELAKKQVLEAVEKLPNEEVLTYIGVHAKSRFSNKRDTLGFVITNFRILIETDISVLFEKENATIILFSMKSNSKQIADEALTIFKKKSTMKIDETFFNGFKNALENTLEIILTELKNENTLPLEIKKASNISDRIKELNLQNDLKSLTENEKLILKFAEKFQISDIKYAMIDKPFFGSSYGLVITNNGITSRDVMEDAISCTWQEIKTNLAIAGEKDDIFYAAAKKHVIPQHKSNSLSNLIILINEIALGEIDL